MCFLFHLYILFRIHDTFSGSKKCPGLIMSQSKIPSQSLISVFTAYLLMHEAELPRDSDMPYKQIGFEKNNIANFNVYFCMLFV